MITAYKRSEVSKILGMSEKWITRTDKVIPVMVWSNRSKKYVKRYLLVNELLNERPIKKRIKD